MRRAIEEQNRKQARGRRLRWALLAAAVVVAVAMSGFLPGEGKLAQVGLTDPWKASEGGPAGVPLRRVAAPAGHEAALVPVGGFPAHARYRAPLKALTARLSQALQGGAESQYFIQIEDLEKQGGAAILSSHGLDWIPIQGLGVWPDREPPSLWNWKDFLFKLRGMPMRVHIHYVFRVTAGAEARDSARNEMGGRGVGMEVFLSEDVDAWLAKTKAALLPKLSEETFRAQAYFVPLLDRDSLAAASPGDLEIWLGGATAYVRESPSDQGLLIVTAKPLEQALEPLGLVRDGVEGWRIPLGE